MEVYIVQAYRTAVEIKKGKLRFTRPDDLASQLINKMTKNSTAR